MGEERQSVEPGPCQIRHVWLAPAPRHMFHTDPRPILSFVQLHGTGTEQIHGRVGELDERYLKDESLEGLLSINSLESGR